MRTLVWGLLVCAACEAKTEPEPGDELTRSQCADMIRRIQRLESDDTADLTSQQAAFGGDISGCLRRGTEEAHRCIMQARDRDDLAECNLLFR